MSKLLITVNIQSEPDVVCARQRARQIASLMHFDPLDQTRIATSVSEIARNAFLYAGGGRAQFFIEGRPSERLMIRISDRGPGIADLASILEGGYQSATGMGLGIAGARRLMDTFRAQTVAGHGTIVEMGKTLPALRPRVTPQLVALIAEELAKDMPSGPLEEIRQQNAELLRALDDLKARQLELDRMYREVTEAHRQVVDINFQLETQTLALQRTTTAERLARSEAEAAVALREDMLAVVSHDLRTPLASIVASAGVLNGMAPRGDSRADENARRSADLIMRSAQRMSSLITDLLDLARIRTGKLTVDRRPVLVSELIQETLDMVRPLAAQGDLALSGASGAGLWVSCDKERVLQILANLLSNAIKFTRQGGSISLEAVVAKREVVFTVADTGEGMSQEDLPHIFDRFWQGRKKEAAGIGLGLSIVAGLVEAHGGRLWAESELGSGSRFFFTLTAVEAPA